MTELLEEAFAKAARLPDHEQDAFARWLMDELESEQPLVTCLRDFAGSTGGAGSGSSRRRVLRSH